MRAHLVATLLLFSCLCNANPTLIISSSVEIRAEFPAQIPHGNNLLIYKYTNWYFSHERLDGARIYPGIDLTGMDREYVHALFDNNVRQSLPKWLGVLAEEQATSFGILKENSEATRSGDLEILTTYNVTEKRGEIFILTKKDIHRLSM